VLLSFLDDARCVVGYDVREGDEEFVLVLTLV
jgi:hypothetical protein